MITILVKLLNEDIDVWRPAWAEKTLREGVFRILNIRANLFPDEEWEFRVGDLVECVEREWEGEIKLVAIALAEN